MRLHLPVSSLTKALFDRLVADLSVDVFEYVPPIEDTPFVSIAPASATTDGFKTIAVYDINIGVEIWSKYLGAKELSDLTDAVIVAVTRNDLDVTADGYRVVRTTFVDYTADKEFTGTEVINHGVLRFAWKVEEV
jgi:hypothetical protein